MCLVSEIYIITEINLELYLILKYIFKILLTVNVVYEIYTIRQVFPNYIKYEKVFLKLLYFFYQTYMAC